MLWHEYLQHYNQGLVWWVGIIMDDDKAESFVHTLSTNAGTEEPEWTPMKSFDRMFPLLSVWLLNTLCLQLSLLTYDHTYLYLSWYHLIPVKALLFMLITIHLDAITPTERNAEVSNTIKPSCLVGLLPWTNNLFLRTLSINTNTRRH